MQTVIANREDFFPPNACPVALRTIQGDGVMQHEGDLTDIRHTHDFSELIIITKGGGEHWINGDIYPVSAGDIFLIQGRTEHYFTERHNLTMYNIMFEDFFMRDQLKTLHSVPGFNAFFFFEPTYRRRHKFQSKLHLEPKSLFPLESLLRRMVMEQKQGAPGFDLLLLARTLEIFVIISREYSCDRNPMVRSLVRLGDLVAKLEKEYTRHWTIAEISKLAAMAPSTLLPIFKSVTGHSPVDYLLHVRLSHGAEELLNGTKPISEIAVSCGFSDSNYFTRQFRKIYNCTPREFRQERIRQEN